MLGRSRFRFISETNLVTSQTFSIFHKRNSLSKLGSNSKNASMSNNFRAIILLDRLALSICLSSFGEWIWKKLSRFEPSSRRVTYKLFHWNNQTWVNSKSMNSYMIHRTSENWQWFFCSTLLFVRFVLFIIPTILRCRKQLFDLNQG